MYYIVLQLCAMIDVTRQRGYGTGTLTHMQKSEQNCTVGNTWWFLVVTVNRLEGYRKEAIESEG